MAPSVKHTFVSPIPDGGDPTIVGPNAWNADHTLVGVQGAIALTTTGTSGPSTFDGTTLNVPQYSVTDTGITQLTGDVTAGPGSGSKAATVVALNNTNLAGLATGFLVNTTSTGVPTIKAAPAGLVVGTSDTQTLTNKNLAGAGNTFPTFNQNTTGNAATVTTNANLTGPITSIGNVTTIASQTGTGVKFVVDTSPLLITPVIGDATGSSLKLASTITTLPATLGGTPSVNWNSITDSAVDAGTGFILGQQNRYSFGGNTSKGGRIAQYNFIANTGATNSANTNRNYVAGVDEVYTNFGDGGTNTSTGAKGAFFGSNPEMFLDTGATNVFNATAMEADTFTATGASVRYLTGIQIVGANAVRGVEVDAALAIYGTTASSGFGPHAGWGNGILFTDIGGVNPFYSASTLIGAYWQGAAPTVANGIDLTGFTFSGNAYASPGVRIGGSGTLGLINSNAGFEIGSTTAANTPFMDWHSSGNAIDYDARIIASGGNASIGNGTLNVVANALFVNSAVVDAEQITILSADNAAPTNVATAQNVFPSGQSTFTALASTTYEFEACYEIDTTGTTSNSLGVLFGGTATFTSIGYDAIVTNGPTALTPSTPLMSRSTVATVQTVTAAVAAATQRTVKLRGTFRVNAAGTIIPQFQFSAAPGSAPVVKANSYFRLWQITSSTITKLGNWS